MTGYPISHQTLTNLIGVRPELCAIVRRALELTTVPFSVYDGLRSPEDQAKALAAGLSQIKQSRHLTGCAVDFYALVNGKAEWKDPTPYCAIMQAFKQASVDLKTPLRWGGVWDKLIADLGPDGAAELKAYAARQAAKGNHHAFEDIDHVELDKATYP